LDLSPADVDAELVDVDVDGDDKAKIDAAIDMMTTNHFS